MTKSDYLKYIIEMLDLADEQELHTIYMFALHFIKF